MAIEVRVEKVSGTLIDSDFIRRELAAGNVKSEGAKQWLGEVLKLAE